MLSLTLNHTGAHTGPSFENRWHATSTRKNCLSPPAHDTLFFASAWRGGRAEKGSEWCPRGPEDHSFCSWIFGNRRRAHSWSPRLFAWTEITLRLWRQSMARSRVDFLPFVASCVYAVVLHSVKWSHFWNILWYCSCAFRNFFPTLPTLCICFIMCALMPHVMIPLHHHCHFHFVALSDSCIASLHDAPSSLSLRHASFMCYDAVICIFIFSLATMFEPTRRRRIRESRRRRILPFISLYVTNCNNESKESFLTL